MEIMMAVPLQVIHSARANATHNHGLDADCLLVGMLIFELHLLTCIEVNYGAFDSRKSP